MLIGMNGLHAENGGFLAHRDLKHSGQWAVNSEQKNSDEVMK
jgi:hypothetical protein